MSCAAFNAEPTGSHEWFRVCCNEVSQKFAESLLTQRWGAESGDAAFTSSDAETDVHVHKHLLTLTCPQCILGAFTPVDLRLDHSGCVLVPGLKSPTVSWSLSSSSVLSPLCPSRPMKPTSWPRKCRRIRTECGYTIVYKEEPQVECRAYSWIGWRVGLSLACRLCMTCLLHTVYIELSYFKSVQHDFDDITVMCFDEDKSNHALMLIVWLKARGSTVKGWFYVDFNLFCWQCFMHLCLLCGVFGHALHWINTAYL